MPKKILQPTSSVEEHSETDNVTAIELHRNRRILHFSDGTMEELSENESDDDIDQPDKCLEVAINENQLNWKSRIKYRALRMGSTIMNGIDYVGGGLASFLGITTPKYASELNLYKRTVDRDNVKDLNANKSWEPNESENMAKVITVAPSSGTGYRRED